METHASHLHCRERPPSSQLLGALGSSRKDTPIIVRRHAIDALLKNGLPYSRKLAAHTSCVNALACSRDGRWLASASDDPYVQMWNFNQDDLLTPTATFSGPTGNVFTLAFSASEQYVYSGDTRNVIYQYDISRIDTPVSRTSNIIGEPSWSHTYHSDSIRAISCHPEQDYLFLSASEDGSIILHDMRANPQYTRAQSILQNSAEFSCVQYHPTMHNIFATSDIRGNVCLRDARMAFGPLSQRRDHGVVHKYATTIAKHGAARMARLEPSSFVFDKEGRRLAVTMLHHLPTLYALNDPYPIAVLSGRNLPDGSLVPPDTKTYSNSCTIKHGTFGGLGSDRDTYYAAGSDDFRTYLWKIPDEDTLLTNRQVVSFSAWATEAYAGEIGYASSYLGDRHIPVNLSVPTARLTGHDSIVNVALIHPNRPYILTSGIERYIRLHSPTAASSCTSPMELTPTEVRSVPASDARSRELWFRTTFGDVDVSGPDEDDSRVIALFDQILRHEGNGDPFDMRVWEPSSDESDENDPMDMVDDDSE